MATYLDGISFATTYWTGMNDLVEENKFRWSDGSVAKFTNWHKNPDTGASEPNNCCGGEDCMAVYRHHKNTWNDYGCKYQFPFICEKSKGNTFPLSSSELSHNRWAIP